jgi:hypothetical protein
MVKGELQSALADRYTIERELGRGGRATSPIPSIRRVRLLPAGLELVAVRRLRRVSPTCGSTTRGTRRPRSSLKRVNR